MPENIISSKKIIEVLFEDEYLIIFNKPANLLVIPSEDNKENTLVNIVNLQYEQRSSSEHKLHPCHRLDRETSGVIVFAKGKKNQQMIMDVFKDRAITKHYIAFIHGKLNKQEGRIDTPVESYHEKKYHRSVGPKEALTLYKVMEVKRDFSIIDIQIVTGRTNQIRIHFKSVGHPLVGDRKYSFGRDHKLKFKRTALHASSISFKHPVTEKQINISVKIPKDMEAFCANN